MAEMMGLPGATVWWDESDVVVQQDAETSVPRSHRLARAPWTSVVGARLERCSPPVVRVELCGVTPARRSRSPWALAVRDLEQAEPLLDLVGAMSAGPRAVPCVVAPPDAQPLPAEPPEPLAAWSLGLRLRVWRLRFERWAATRR